MALLAAVGDLEVRLGQTLSGADADRAEALLADASSAFISAAGGQQIIEETTTDRLRVRNRRVTLPQRPVTDVASVVDLNDVAVTFDRRNEVLYLDLTSGLNWFEVEPRRTGLVLVDVEYTHGYPQVPDDVIGVVCQMAARAFGVPASGAGVSQESLGAYSYTVGTAAASGGFGMLPDERRIADSYRHDLGSLTVSP